MLWQIVFKFNCIDSIEFIGNQGLSSDHATNFAVRSLVSFDYDVDLVLQSRSSQLCHLESKLSWEVFVKDGNPASCVVSVESLTVLSVINFKVEIQVWLPVVIVNNLNIDNFFSFLFLHRADLVDSHELIAGAGSTINRFHSEGAVHVHVFLDNANCHGTGTFCN